MSASLLKRSLEIVEENLEQTDGKNKKTVPGYNKKGSSYSDTQKKTDNKQPAKLTCIGIQHRNEAKQRQVESNLKKILLLEGRKPKIDILSKQKIFQRARTNRYVLDVDNTSDTTVESIFTEEDFERFEKEYFP